MPTRLDDLVHFHCPKTGGAATHAALMAAGGERIGNGHDLWPHWRDEMAGLRPFGTVRDPWTRYASLYFHALRVTRAPMLEVYGGGSGEFRDVLRGWTRPETARIPREVGVIWGPGKAEKLVRSGLGLYSWELCQVYGNGMHAYVAQDRLEEGLGRLFGRKVPVPRQNANPEPVDYRSLYDDEMIEWIAESEAGIIARFGWEPFEPSPQAVYLAG